MLDVINRKEPFTKYVDKQGERGLNKYERNYERYVRIANEGWKFTVS